MPAGDWRRLANKLVNAKPVMGWRLVSPTGARHWWYSNKRALIDGAAWRGFRYRGNRAPQWTSPYYTACGVGGYTPKVAPMWREAQRQGWTIEREIQPPLSRKARRLLTATARMESEAC